MGAVTWMPPASMPLRPSPGAHRVGAPSRLRHALPCLEDGRVGGPDATPYTTARGISPALVAVSFRVRPSPSSVSSQPRRACKLLRRIVFGENIWLACSLVGVAIARACKRSA
eukprot:892028-Pleurochrysis_carterae.AAC.1